MFPYLCVDLSLSEQLEHLSAAAHLSIALYRAAGGKAFIPTELFIDIMLMVKNIFFCVAKAKVDDPDGSFWIGLLGTDRLEELFGIVRTMVGNDANPDIYQLYHRLTGTTEVSNIFARWPKWDRSPRRLKVPAIDRLSKKLPDGADHLKPGSWRSDVKTKHVSLHTAWKRGRQMVATDQCAFTTTILHDLEQTQGADILSPFGTLLVNVPLATDDIEESLADITISRGHPLLQDPLLPHIQHNLDNRMAIASQLPMIAFSWLMANQCRSPASWHAIANTGRRLALPTAFEGPKRLNGICLLTQLNTRCPQLHPLMIPCLSSPIPLPLLYLMTTLHGFA